MTGRIDIEIIPDRMGVVFLRTLADAIENHLDQQAGALVELPFAVPDKLGHAALVELTDAIDQTGALDTGLDLDTVWVVVDAFLFVGTGNRPTDLIDALIDVGSSMSDADEGILLERVNGWLRRTDHGYQIVEDGDGGYHPVESPAPAFKARRMSFKVLP
ncbi:hypothetical protein G6O69_01080 [Pseudenhygromyxa sp. WMMC2535]|uniref:hypothetical protein n=1 Tax=Pseudenhygromyxa sp. WMMC2535 TaxID=2712867 RepID=UPI0015567DDC|nr:hypothetical protein [Pseudenhygromyxa sp. WMMC2535]NVB36404.1 hypothetical protein [Pseudenhygromyxa sp. WMMC2535]